MSQGIEETKEALEGLFELSIVLAELLSDGAQLSDIVALFSRLQNDEDFKNKLKKAAEGISKVPAEAADLSTLEVIKLASLTVSYLPKILKSIGKNSVKVAV